MDGGYGGRDDSVGVGSCTGISPISSTLNLGLVHIARAQPRGRRSHSRHSEEGLQRRLVRIRARQSNTASQPSEQTGRSIPVRLERISRRCNPSSLGRAPPVAPPGREAAASRTVNSMALCTPIASGRIVRAQLASFVTGSVLRSCREQPIFPAMVRATYRVEKPCPCRGVIRRRVPDA
jgi:hypothetical protein